MEDQQQPQPSQTGSPTGDAPPKTVGEGFSPGGDQPLRRFVLPGLFVVGLFVALFLRQPGDDDAALPPIWIFKGPTMGTTYTVKIVVPDDPPPTTTREATDAAILAALGEVNDSMSTYKEDSELSRFNRHQDTDVPFKISPDLMTVLLEARRIHTLSGGAFDVTVGPVVDAWGFGPDKSKTRTPPSDEALSKARALVGMDKVLIDEKGATLGKTLPGVQIDLSAIAKGYGADKVALALDKLAHRAYMVEVGGEVRARGRNPEGAWWRIGIEKPDPDTRTIHEIVPLEDTCLATSGDYRNFYERDGVRLSHTIDARTGRPITHRLASVSVLYPDCVGADGLATALNVLGDQDGPKVAEREGLKALFILRQTDGTFTEVATTDFKALRTQHNATTRTPPGE